MKFSIQERVALLGLLPKQGNYLNLKILRKLKESLSFNESELESIDFQQTFVCPTCAKEIISPSPVTCEECKVTMQPSGAVFWTQSKDPMKDVHLGKQALKLCREALEKLNEEENLEENLMGLYEKVVGIPDEEEE